MCNDAKDERLAMAREEQLTIKSERAHYVRLAEMQKILLDEAERTNSALTSITSELQDRLELKKYFIHEYGEEAWIREMSNFVRLNAKLGLLPSIEPA